MVAQGEYWHTGSILESSIMWVTEEGKCAINAQVYDTEKSRPGSSWPKLPKVISTNLKHICCIQVAQENCVQAPWHMPQGEWSAYKAHHYTETAALKVLSDILLTPYSGDVTILMMLDLSAAFSSFDHVTVLVRLKIFEYRTVQSSGQYFMYCT